MSSNLTLSDKFFRQGKTYRIPQRTLRGDKPSSERYDVSGIPQMQMAFDGPNVDDEFTEDKWGVWLSGYAPIYNSHAQAVAIVGLDVSARSVIQIKAY